MPALERLVGRVWWYPADPDPDKVLPGVAVITGDAGSVVVDAGHSPAVARRIQAEMRRLGLPAARWLVYTHHHWDHTWGACAWDDVEVIGHESGRPLLEAEAARPWSHEYLRAEVAANPLLGPSFRARAAAMESWEGFRVVPPGRVFTDTLPLPGGILVRHVGGNHARDSTVVAAQEEAVLLLGDTFYPPPYHLREAGDGPDLAQVRGFLDEGFEWYVDAHSAPRRWEEAAGLVGV